MSNGRRGAPIIREMTYCVQISLSFCEPFKFPSQVRVTIDYRSEGVDHTTGNRLGLAAFVCVSST